MIGLDRLLRRSDRKLSLLQVIFHTPSNGLKFSRLSYTLFDKNVYLLGGKNGKLMLLSKDY